jgi:hypothetical protein
VARGSSTRRLVVPSSRLLIVDEQLDVRLASQLEQRGRAAKSASLLGLTGLKDEDLLRAIGRLDESDPVLITGDDKMPSEHGKVIAKLGLTIATIDGRRKPNWPAEAWKKETVHRWAHVMQAQPAGTLRRYSVSGHVPWVSRRGS